MRSALSTLFCVYVCIDRAWLFPSSFIPLPICYSSSLYNSISLYKYSMKRVLRHRVFLFVNNDFITHFLVLFYHTAYCYPSILHICPMKHVYWEHPLVMNISYELLVFPIPLWYATYFEDVWSFQLNSPSIVYHWVLQGTVFSTCMGVLF
jgi:Na+-transporting NADH:ubiquinone oxidoreductase subunit NqrB